MSYRLALTFAVMTCCAAFQAAADDIGIRGRVMDDDGAALSGAVVELVPWLGSFDDGLRRLDAASDAGEPRATGRSDGQGYFKLTASVGGSFRLKVEAAGRMPMEIRLAHLTDDVELRSVELLPASKRTLRVVSGTGKPLVGATVEVVSRYGRGEDWQPAGRFARTGAAGTVEVEFYESMRESVAAFVSGLVPAREPRPGSRALTLELATGSARTIEVRDAAGSPVAGALIRVGRHAWPAGISGEDGRFVVHPPVDGELYVVVETSDGHRGSRRIPAPKGEEVDPLTLELEPLATISGLVSDALTDKPLTGARVWLSADPHRFVDSARDGSYSLSFPASRRSASQPRAAALGYLRSAKSASFRSTGAKRDFALQPAVPLNGRVVDGLGDAIEDAEISASSAAGRPMGRFPGGSPGHVIRSQSDGGFQLRVARDVVYQLEIAKSGYLSARAEAAADGSDQELEIVLGPGLAGTGQVVDMGDIPVPGAEVRLSEPMPPSRHYPYDLGELRHRITTDPEGRFEVSNLAPGKLDLKVTAPGFAPAEVRGVDIAQGDDGTVDFGTVVLAPGVRLEGRVVDPDGQPLAAASIQWIPWRGVNFRGFSGDPNIPGVTSGADGRFVIEDLARGAKITLEARLKGYSEAQAAGVEAPTSESVVLVLEPKATIRGLVVDNLGAPVPEAILSISNVRADGGSSGTQRRCDADGRFEVEVDATGRLKLSAASEELKSTVRWLEVAPGQVVDDVRLVLETGAVVEGVVLGPAGEPVVGAGVRVFSVSLLRHHSEVTGDDGEFRLGSLEVGQLTIHVTAEGYPQADQELEVRPGTNAVEIRLRQSNEVHGRVVDEALEPVGGAQVMLNGRDGQGEAFSDAEGTFVVTVPDGRYRLQAGKPGVFAWAYPEEEIEVAGAPVFGLEVRLIEGGAITGQVLGLAPERLAVVTVSVRSGHGSSSVDHQGRYRIEHLPPREWLVVATVPGSGLNARGRTVLAPGDRESVLDLEFTPGLTLTGRVLVDDQPVTGATIEARRIDGPAPDTRRFSGRHAVTDYQGGFRMVDLPPGQYRLEVRKESIVQYRELELTTDREIEIELRSHGLSGRVVDAADGEPLQNAIVALESAIGEIPTTNRPPSSPTDATGRFSFARVAEGSYRLRVALQGYAPLALPLEVAAGAVLEDLDLRLDRTEGLTLSVQLAAGGELRNIWVAALGAAGNIIFNHGFEVTEGGNVHLSSLPAGSSRLIVAARRAGTIQLTVDVPGEPVPVLLPPDTVLDVRVPELAALNEAAALTVTDPAGRLFLELSAGSPYPTRQWIVREGRATVTGLPPGQWNVEVTAAGGRSWSASVATQGGRMQVDIE